MTGAELELELGLVAVKVKVGGEARECADVDGMSWRDEQKMSGRDCEQILYSWVVCAVHGGG